MTAARARRRVCNPVLWPGQEPFALYTEGDDLYAAMLSAIAAAEHARALEEQFEANPTGAEELDPAGGPPDVVTERLLAPVAWGARRCL